MKEINKKKVVYMITKAIWGGAQSYVYDLALNLDKTKYDCAVISGEGEELVNRLKEANIRTIKIEDMTRDINPLKEIYSFINLFKTITRERPDVLHLNSSKAGLLGTIAGRLAGVPNIIFTIHGFAFNEKRSNLEKIFFKLLHYITIFLSHKTIIVSHKTKNDIVGWPFIENKITVIHNGVKKFEALSKEESRNFLTKKIIEVNSEIKNDELIIGTISELHNNKGIDIMIDVIKDLDPSLNFRYIIIGSGEKEDGLKKIVKKHNLGNKILFTGKIPEAKKYLKAFDLFTLTSRTEAMPYVILEAGFIGLPILATSVGGIPEIIDNRENGVLAKARKESIKESLEYLFDNKNKWPEFGQKIKEKVEKEFSFEEMIRRTVELYK